MCTKGYYVTVMNDGSLFDNHGAIHSWLEIGCSDAPLIYFSFGNTDTASLFGKDSPGSSSASQMVTRPPTEKHTISITRNQYDALVKAATDFFTHSPRYDLTPDHDQLCDGRTLCAPSGWHRLSEQYSNAVRCSAQDRRQIFDAVDRGTVERPRYLRCERQRTDPVFRGSR